MDTRATFFLYRDLQARLADLDDESMGQLFFAILDHVNGVKDVQIPSPVARMAFSFVAAEIDRADQYHKELAEKRKEAGSRGGNQKQANISNSKQTVAKGSKSKQTEAKATDKDKDKDKDKDINTNRAFTAPTVEQVAAYVKENNLNVSADRFVSYYTSTGWKVGGKAPMKDWKAACRNWDSRERENTRGTYKADAEPDYTELLQMYSADI